MKTSIITSIVAIAAVSLLTISSFSSCKDPKPEPDKYGNMKVQFNYVWGSNMEPWELNKEVTHPKTGDVMTFTMFKYFVSNIKLKKANGDWWVQPNSYFLLNAESKDASSIAVNNIPAGDYVAMEYTMGVDSARNVSGANDGALSLSTGMFWDWNSGYIMLKAEGTSPNSPVNVFAFHLGGFSGEYNIVTVKTTDFGGNKLTISEDGTKEVEFIANPARLWHSSPSVSVKSTIHAPGPEAKTMADDFYSNISFGSIK